MNGHQRTTGNWSMQTSFLIHHQNQGMNRSRLVITELFSENLFIYLLSVFA